MSLLREIQDAVTGSDVELTTILRKCKILSARLGNTEFKQWVENELNGYSDQDNLPKYRVLNVNSKGHFSGPFQSGIKNADIPLSCIPEKYRENLKHSYLCQPVAAIESLVNSSSVGIAQEQWNPDLVAYVGQGIYKSMNCFQAWKVIPIPALVATLDAVKNRILSFVIEIESEAPNAGEAPLNSNPVPQDKVHQIFNTYITGDVQNVATGSSNFKQKASKTETPPKVFKELLDAMKSITDTELSKQVSLIIEEMKESHGTPKFVDKYKEFMSLFADHIQVLQPVITPILPALATLIA